MDDKIIKISKYSDEEFKNYLKKEKLEFLHSLKLYLDDKYYNTGEDTILSDYQYDLLKDALHQRQPEYIPPVGTKIRKDDNKVILKYWMGSMDKLKPENISELNRWLKKNEAPNYIVENKLDGVSCLLEIDDTRIKLYTRGDGKIGSDISHLSPYLINIPKNIKKNIIVRGELLINSQIFKKKYEGKFSNARNMVSGIINSKTLKEEIKNVEFVAYEIINNEINNSPEEQLLQLKNLGFKTVKYSIIDEVTVQNLISLFLLSKEDSEYEIDGIIVQSNIKYKRNTSGNPDYAFAFKVRLDTNIIKAEVDEVEWNISKWGIIKPRIRLIPVVLNGINIQYTSGFNARYILNNKVGKGTIVELTRAGDVIPYIVKIVKSTQADMPKISYEWNKTNVDIYALENSNTVCIKLLTFIFSKLKIKYVSNSTVEKLYDNGFDNIIKIISATKDDFKKIEGFGNKVGERTYDNIHNSLKDVSIPLILGSSGIFGFNIGVRRIELLFVEYPDILTIYKKKSKNELTRMINSIKGFSNITTEKIVDNLKWADKFITLLRKHITFKVDEKNSGDLNNLNNMIIVFSGFRDADMEEDIKKRGGKVTTSISKNTTLLIVNKKDVKNSKYIKALELKVPILTKEEFENLINFSNKIIIEKLKLLK